MKDPKISKIPRLANLWRQFQQDRDAATNSKAFDQELAQPAQGEASQAPRRKE